MTDVLDLAHTQFIAMTWSVHTCDHLLAVGESGRHGLVMEMGQSLVVGVLLRLLGTCMRPARGAGAALGWTHHVDLVGRHAAVAYQTLLSSYSSAKSLLWCQWRVANGVTPEPNSPLNLTSRGRRPPLTINFTAWHRLPPHV